MGYPRQEMEEMWGRWTAANEAAEAANDWTGLGDFYTEDARYTWTVGHHGEFAAHGRQDIID
ncbi:MAG: nuclear transport factor 2 family protein, partial [Acidimicrobiaceae bacterium]|nr:nuclear transport factor 2 family protein [Acidimicrobiaceae bacterium]